jgi:hypothetical protein
LGTDKASGFVSGDDFDLLALISKHVLLHTKAVTHGRRHEVVSDGLVISAISKAGETLTSVGVRVHTTHNVSVVDLERHHRSHVVLEHVVQLA